MRSAIAHAGEKNPKIFTIVEKVTAILGRNRNTTAGGRPVKYDHGFYYDSGIYYNRWYSEDGNAEQSGNPTIKVEDKKGIIISKEDKPRVKVKYP